MADASPPLSNIPVEVLCLSAEPIIIRNGHLTTSEPGLFTVSLEEIEPALKPGMRVVLAGIPENPLRINALITGISENRLTAKTIREVREEKRDFPRLYGGIKVRYRVVKKEEDSSLIKAWVDGDDSLSQKGEWHEPDPFMDFSSSGLKFEDQPRCTAGDILLLEIQVPTSKDRWHATARVVRVEAIPQDQADPLSKEAADNDSTNCQIAIHFQALPNDAAEAIAAFSLKIQDALLMPEEKAES